MFFFSFILFYLYFYIDFTVIVIHSNYWTALGHFSQSERKMAIYKN